MTDDPMLRLRYYKETGQLDEAKQYEAYLRETGQWKDTRSLASRAAERRRLNANDREQAEAETPSYGTQALGGIAALVRDIPGAEALQAGARSLVRGQKYTDALTDIRGAEADNPASIVARIAGAVPAVAAIPGSAVLSGARYGVASGLLGADPAGIGERLKDAAVQGTVGAIAGKAGEWLGTGVKALRAKTLGSQALKRKAAMQGADEVAYGAAEAEGNRIGSSPAIIEALAASDIAPYAAAIRGSRTFANANDATVLREAYKLMSEHQTKLANSMANAADFKAGTSLGAAETQLAKREMVNAAETPWTQTTPAVMGEAPAITTAQSPAPSIRDAVGSFWDRIGQTHARKEGTVAQRMARESLERHGAEASVPPIRGTPPGPRPVELSPAQSVGMPAPMPSWRAAIEQHARLKGEEKAAELAADAATRIVKGTSVAGKKLTKNSPEAFLEAVKKMTPKEAQSALDAFLGRVNEKVGLSIHPLEGFGIPNSIVGVNRAAPYLKALRKQAGQRQSLFPVAPVALSGLLDM